MGSVPISMDWEGTKAGGRCGGRELESSWCGVRGYGRGSCWSGLRVRPCCSVGLPGQGRVPAKHPSGPCCSSLWMSWHCKELVPPCPQGWVILLGCQGLYPSTASRSFPAAPEVFWGQRESWERQAGHCSEGRGRACSTVLRELCFFWHLAGKAATGNGIFLLGAFTGFSFPCGSSSTSNWFSSFLSLLKYYLSFSLWICSPLAPVSPSPVSVTRFAFWVQLL